MSPFNDQKSLKNNLKKKYTWNQESNDSVF